MRIPDLFLAGLGFWLCSLETYLDLTIIGHGWLALTLACIYFCAKPD